MNTPDHLPRGLIQVAGVHTFDEARMLLNAGVDLVGIPLRLTVNREDLTDRHAAAISRKFPHRCCLITYLDTVRGIVELVNLLEISWVQLHGPIDPANMPELSATLPDVSFIKSLIIGRYDQPALHATMEQFTPFVDAFITDSFDPQTGAEGATGKCHDWQVSRQLVAACRRPVILAGGLDPDNVEDAIRQVQPWGVDVHTGVEDANGLKDPGLVEQFVASAKAAFRRF